MVLSRCSVKGDKVISLYMPMLAAHLSLNERTVDDIKTEVVKNGGKRNASCRFLRPGSRDNVCNSTNNQVCVLCHNVHVLTYWFVPCVTVTIFSSRQL